MTTVVAHAPKTPRCSRNLLEAHEVEQVHFMAGKFRANAPMVSLSRPQFTCIPSDPCRHAVGGTRPQDGTCTAPTLGAGWCRVNPTASGFHGVEHSSTSLNIPQAPHRLFQGSVQQQTIRPSLTQRSSERMRLGMKRVGPSTIFAFATLKIAQGRAAFLWGVTLPLCRRLFGKWSGHASVMVVGRVLPHGAIPDSWATMHIDKHD